jgi:hypothetical protein
MDRVNLGFQAVQRRLDAQGVAWSDRVDTCQADAHHNVQLYQYVNSSTSINNTIIRYSPEARIFRFHLSHRLKHRKDPGSIPGTGKHKIFLFAPLTLMETRNSLSRSDDIACLFCSFTQRWVNKYHHFCLYTPAAINEVKANGGTCTVVEVQISNYSFALTLDLSRTGPS